MHQVGSFKQAPNLFLCTIYYTCCGSDHSLPPPARHTLLLQGNKKIGNVSFYDSSGQRDTGFQKPYSEETGKLIDEEVRKLVNDAYELSKEILTQHKRSLISVAELLLQKEVIFKEDLETILGRRPGEKDTGPVKDPSLP